MESERDGENFSLTEGEKWYSIKITYEKEEEEKKVM